MRMTAAMNANTILCIFIGRSFPPLSVGLRLAGLL
jgi:hypothetical protein